MTIALPARETRPLAPRLLVSLLAALSLILGPLAFAPANADPAGSVVSGTIAVAEGDSPSGASVWLDHWEEGDERGHWVTKTSTYTDEDGFYTFEGEIEPGTRYRVVSDGPPEYDPVYTLKYATNESAEFDVTGSTTTAPLLTLVVGGSISGTVTADGGAALPGARVIAERFLDDHYAYEREVASDEDGDYTVAGLRDGRYRLQFSADQYLTEYFDDVPYEYDVTGVTEITIQGGTVVVDTNASLTEAAVVSGTVRDTDDDPIQGIAVSAYREVSDEDGTRWETFQRYDFTNDDGTYAIDDLPAGTYRIGFDDQDGNHVAEFYDDKPAVDSAGIVDFDLAAGETAPDVDAVLAPAGFITGSLVGPEGDAVDNGCIVAMRKTDGTYSEAGGTEASTYGSDIYRIGGLAAGTYKVRFADCDDDTALASEYFDNQPTLAAATEIDVVARETVADVNGSLALAPVVVPPAPYTPPAAPAPVVKKSASVKVSAKGAKKKATLTITVKASGVTPTGKVTIKLGNKTLKTVTLKGGKAKVTLTKQKKGKRTYKITYSGDSRVLGKTVSTSKVKIT